MFIQRDLAPVLTEGLESGKVVVLFGARQTGKTTLARHILEGEAFKAQGVLSLNGDNPAHRAMLAYDGFSLENFRRVIGDAATLFIDEAQNVKGIGQTLKLLHDSLPGRRVLVTGSSSFALSGQVGEPLVGRKFEYELHPFSFGELARHASVIEEREAVATRIVYGGYPEIVAAKNLDDAARRLKELCGGYLYKDILAWKSVKGPVVLEKLLKALALQIGSEVSFSEIAGLIGIDKESVERYLDLLTKCYVCFSVPSFARNVRNELKKSKKVYFRDCGVRNGVLGNFLPLDCRDDVGRLWENYLVCERLKTLSRRAVPPQCYFWRTAAQAEIDWVEESAAEGLRAYEFKWGRSAKARCPEAFKKAYPAAAWACVTRDNYDAFANGEI
ncbi:MAG: ATP-binding protein [Planctomycetes bacterium]|nr:ATP-binding protein [Planctomycetota bacterium]